MRGNSFKNCRICGKPIGVIEWGVYRKVLVDAEALDVVPDPQGEEFVRIDGSKIRGRVAEPGTLQTEPAYRPHRKTCGVTE
jgi:hypothetical protein